MSKTVRSPDGHVKAADAVQLFVSITDADSPYDLAQDVYLLADSAAAPVTVNLPTAREGDILTVSHPAGATQDVVLNPVAGETIDGVAGARTISANGITSFRALRSAAGVFGWSEI